MDTSSTRDKLTTYRLFGLTLASDFHLTKRVALSGDSTPDLTFTQAVVESLPGNWASVSPSYVSPYETKDGETLLRAYRQGECDMLRFPNTADFYIWSDRIVCYRLQCAHRYEVERWLVGTVLALWLERKGIPVAHASAVVLEDCAVAFLASNAAGKSSLAAALMQCGYPLLTDDVLPIKQCDTMCIGHPGYPKVRLWPDVAEHILGHYADLELVHPEASKRSVPVGPEGLGVFCDTPQPLGCLYIPSRREPKEGETPVEITPVSKREALLELLRYSFSARLLAAMGLQPQRLNSLARIAREVPIRRIKYPIGLEHLPCTCETILEDVRSLRH